MNNGPMLFFGILGALGFSFWTLLFAPQVQIGRNQPVLVETTGELYPAQRPGLAQQGAEIYRSLGCAECHSQQTRQTGFAMEVWLAEPGTNQAELATTLAKFQIPAAEATRLMQQAPVKLLGGLDPVKAQTIAGQITNGGARAQAVLENLGPDIRRGWGRRATVTQDFLADYPVQLGALRLGPDLANYGLRHPGAASILAHLYAPQKTMPGSMMPPYRFLFDKRKLDEGEKTAWAVEPGFEITPKPEAEALVAYVMSLKADAPLPEAPVPMPPTKPEATATNAPPK